MKSVTITNLRMKRQEAGMMELEIKDERRDGVCVFALNGEIDVYTAPKIKERLVAAIDEGCTRIVLEMNGVFLHRQLGTRRARECASPRPGERRRCAHRLRSRQHTEDLQESQDWTRSFRSSPVSRRRSSSSHTKCVWRATCCTRERPFSYAGIVTEKDS